MLVGKGDCSVREQGQKLLYIGLRDYVAPFGIGVGEIGLQCGIVPLREALSHIPEGIYKSFHFPCLGAAAVGQRPKGIYGEGDEGNGDGRIVPVGKSGDIVMLLLPQFYKTVGVSHPIQVPIVEVGFRICFVHGGNTGIPDAHFQKKLAQTFRT